MSILTLDDEADLKRLYTKSFRRKAKRRELCVAFTARFKTDTYLKQHPTAIALPLSDCTIACIGELAHVGAADFSTYPHGFSLQENKQKLHL